MICTLAVIAAAGLAAPAKDTQAAAREALVEHIERQGVRDKATLDAMRAVPRHEFVRPQDVDDAYSDHPLPIGEEQTISQPYIVAYMTEALRPRPGLKVLEVGTGSGYQAAVLAAAGASVWSVELIGSLAKTAAERLKRLGYDTVRVRHGDGYEGWKEAAPFDAIIVTAAPGFIPPALVEQLKPGGRMVLPVGAAGGAQNLILVEKDAKGITTDVLLPVRFVPMRKGLR